MEPAKQPLTSDQPEVEAKILQKQQQQQPIQQQPIQQQGQQQVPYQQQPGMMVQQQQQPQQMYQQQPQQQQMYQQPGQPGMMQGQPGQPLQPGQQVVYVQHTLDQRHGLEKLASLPALFVKERLQVLQAVTGCQQENVYDIFAAENTGERECGTMQFQAKEHSSWAARNCLAGSCRPFEMTISHKSSHDPQYEKPFLLLKRECRCTFLCFNRPELEISLVENGEDRYLGKVLHPFNCCILRQQIFDANNVMKYQILGDCCQLGIFCKCPCEPCQTIQFTINDGAGKAIAVLEKRRKGCFQALVSDADNFFMEHPAIANGEDRALLLGALMMLDFNYFKRGDAGRGMGNR